MLDAMQKATRFLWALVESLFVVLLALILIYMFLGQNSGVFIISVVQNVTSFTNSVSAPNLIGFSIILALLYLLRQRLH